MRATWEYIKVEATYLSGLIAKCNQEGEEGWELVTVIPQEGGDVAILKRPVNYY